jgi:RecA/RadA recombinase
MQKINSELVSQIKTLAEIARKREIPVIVTNQVYKWDDESKMVGGDILKYWGKCHIELVNQEGNRLAFLRKHRSLPEKEFNFQIVNSGIKKKGWI